MKKPNVIQNKRQNVLNTLKCQSNCQCQITSTLIIWPKWWNLVANSLKERRKNTFSIFYYFFFLKLSIQNQSVFESKWSIINRRAHHRWIFIHQIHHFEVNRHYHRLQQHIVYRQQQKVINIYENWSNSIKWISNLQCGKWFIYLYHHKNSTEISVIVNVSVSLIVNWFLKPFDVCFCSVPIYRDKVTVCSWWSSISSIVNCNNIWYGFTWFFVYLEWENIMYVFFSAQWLQLVSHGH